MEKIKIAVSGYNGLIGSALVRRLGREGMEVVKLPRGSLYEPESSTLVELLTGVYALVHLAGAPVIARWTSRNRKLIYESRTKTTRNLVNAIIKLPEKSRPKLFLSASAIGIYKSGEYHDESSKHFDSHFGSQVTQDWESASDALPQGIRRVIFRIAIVLSRDAQIIKRLLLPFKAGLGATLGNGRQPFPFIHLHDATDAVIWAVKNEIVSGIYNLSAPEIVTNRDFTLTMGRLLQRPAIFRIPLWVLKLIMGEASAMVADSPGALPGRLLSAGFQFRYPKLEDALTEVIGKKDKKRGHPDGRPPI